MFLAYIRKFLIDFKTSLGKIKNSLKEWFEQFEDSREKLKLYDFLLSFYTAILVCTTPIYTSLYLYFLSNLNLANFIGNAFQIYIFYFFLKPFQMNMYN